MSYFARREPFGGILADTDSDFVYLVDELHFDAVVAYSEGVPLDQSIALLTDKFSPREQRNYEAAARNVYSFLGGNSDKIDSIASRSDFLSEFPTLSAPLDLYWEVTRRCNETCLHCYNNSSPEGFNPEFEKLESIISELGDIRFRTVTLTGGEPMMRRDFWDIVELIRPKTYQLVMGTNATLINERNIHQVAKNFDVLNISLDCADPLEFDRFRGYPGAFERTIKAIDLLSHEDVKIYIQSVITRSTKDHIRDLGILLSRFNIEKWVVRFAFDSGRANENVDEFLTGREVFELQDELGEIQSEFSRFFPSIEIGSNYPWSYAEPYQPVKNPDSLMTCQAATVTAALDAFGQLAPCSLFTETDFKSESVYKTGLLEQWKNANEFKIMRSMKISDVSGCGTCSNALGKCGGGCRAKAYMKYGTVYKNDYSCNYSR